MKASKGSSVGDGRRDRIDTRGPSRLWWRSTRATNCKFSPTAKLITVSWGRLVANAKKRPLREVFKEYRRLFKEALSVDTTVGKHANVLQHIAGYFTDRLEPSERARMTKAIENYRLGLASRRVPLALIRCQVEKHDIDLIWNQTYLLSPFENP
jgi:uncharacterized protein YbgA (DUF1722 family)